MTDDETRQDREAILARRRRFVAATLTGLTTSTLATACPCLKAAPPEPEPRPSTQGDESEEADDASSNLGEAPAEENAPAEETAPAEGPPAEVEDEAVLGAIEFGQKYIAQILEMMNDMRGQAGVEKRDGELQVFY